MVYTSTFSTHCPVPGIEMHACPFFLGVHLFYAKYSATNSHNYMYEEMPIHGRSAGCNIERIEKKKILNHNSSTIIK
jgi:hypothetical protein